MDVLPTVPAHVLKPLHSNTSPPPEPFHNQNETNGLPRSASYSHLPGVQESQPTEGIKRTFSDNVLALSPDGSPQLRHSPYVPSKELLRSASRRGKGKIAVTKFTLSAEDLGGSPLKEMKKPGPVPVTEKSKPSTGRSVSSTFRNLARRSWKTSSRSPSPAPREHKKLAKSRNSSPDKKQSISIVSEPVVESPPAASRPPFSDGTELRTYPETTLSAWQKSDAPNKTSRRPLSAILQMNKSETQLKLSKKPSLPSLRSNGSSDKMSKMPLVNIPPIPSSLSSDRLSSASTDINRKKDPLWSVFRALEGDFQK